MKLNQWSNEYKKFFDEELAKFSKKTGINFSNDFGKYFLENFSKSVNDTFANIDKDKKLKKKSEQEIKDIKGDYYEKVLKHFSQYALKNILYSDGEVQIEAKNYKADNSNYEKESEDDLDAIYDILGAFNSLICNISVAYLAEHELPRSYNLDLGGISNKDFTIIMDPYADNSLFKNQEYRMELLKKDKTNPDEKSDQMIEDLGKAVSDVFMNDYEISNDDYTHYIDNALINVNNPDIIYDPNDEDLEYPDELTINIERMATVYTALRDKYHNENSFFTNWFTPRGWKESKTINETRDKMMKTLGITDKKAFNDLMEKASKKGTVYSKNFRDVATAVKNTYAPNARDIELDLVDRFTPKISKDLVDVPDEIVNEKQGKVEQVNKTNPELNKDEVNKNIDSLNK